MNKIATPYKLNNVHSATGGAMLGLAFGAMLSCTQPASAMSSNIVEPQQSRPPVIANFRERFGNRNLGSGQRAISQNKGTLQLAKIVSNLKHYADPSLQRSKFTKIIIDDFISKDGLNLIDQDVSASSLALALQFLMKLPINYAMPAYDVHPDKEFSFVWSIKNGPILSLAFSNNETIRYAYFSPLSKERVKGQIAKNDISFAGLKRSDNALALLLAKIAKQPALS